MVSLNRSAGSVVGVAISKSPSGRKPKKKTMVSLNLTAGSVVGVSIPKSPSGGKPKKKCFLTPDGRECGRGCDFQEPFGQKTKTTNGFLTPVGRKCGRGCNFHEPFGQKTKTLVSLHRTAGSVAGVAISKSP